ncbi:unnamed protein product [Sphagnum tenellum]
MEEEDMEWSLKSGWRTRDGNLAKHVSLLQVYADESVRRKYAELLVPADDDIGAAILVPAPDSSGPCEVTVQFQHRLCHVHRIQVLSSAKTCEIYNQNEGAADSEYLCTVRGHEVVQVPLMEVRDGEVNGEDWTDGELEFVDSSDGLVNNCKDAGDEQEIFVKNKEKHDVNSSLVMNSDRVLPGRVLYRVEVEFEDPDPCISLTIRLLSLEEKFVVDIEDIVITVSSGPVLTALNSSTSLNSKVQGLIGGKEAGLLGMLVPSMLQMVQGLSGSNKRKEGTQAASVSGNNLVTGAASMQSMLTPSREPLMHALMARLEPGGSKGKVADPPAVEVTRDASIAEVCERLDRLEGLCMRIETSLCKALESFDRRIELLESRQNWEAQLPHASPVVYESRGGPEAEVPISSSHAALTSVQSCSLFKGAFSSTTENISPFPGTATSVAPSTPSTSLAKAQSLSPPSPISSASVDGGAVEPVSKKMKAAAAGAPAEEAAVAASATTTTTPEAVNVPPADAKSLDSEENKQVAKTEDVIEKKEDAAVLKKSAADHEDQKVDDEAQGKKNDDDKKAVDDSAAAVVPEAESKDLSAITHVDGTISSSFKEESNFIADLKESEKKALQDFKEKIEALIKSNGFALPPPTSVEIVPPKTAAAAAEETSESKEAPEEEEKEDISLWGVPLSESKGDERTNVILLKFLRARDFKVDEACSMLVNTIRWRKSFFKADTEEEEQQQEGAAEEDSSELDSFFYMQGSDKEHHPVCYNNWGAFQDKDLYNKTFGDATKIQNFVRWRVRVLEKGIKQLDFVPGGHSAILQVNDVKNIPLFKKEMRGVIIGFVTLLQDNYPELVVKNVFVNTPWYFSALYSVISPFITQRMKRKIVLARPGQIFKSIAPENVPVQYGGFAQPNDTAFAGVKYSVEQLSIKAGEKESIEIALEQAGSTAVWDLSVIGWDISYGVEFAPTATESYHSIIEKTRKIVSVEEPIRTTFKCVEPGKLVLSIDNTASRKKKLVVYRFKVTAAPAAGDGSYMSSSCCY